MRALTLGALLACSCSFTVAGDFTDCAVDNECGAAGICSAGYCLPLPEGCRRFDVTGGDNDPSRTEGSVPLAALLPLTREDGTSDDSEGAGLDAFALALSQVNNYGGLPGTRLFNLYVCDTRRDDKRLIERLAWMVENARTPALLTSGSGQTLGAARDGLRKDAGTFIISATATSPALNSAFVTDRNVWRVAPDDTQQTRVLLKLVQRDFPDAGGVKVGVAWEETPYGEGLGQPLALALRGAGYTVQESSWRPGSSGTLPSAVTLVANFAPHATVLITFPPDVRNFVAQTHGEPGATTWLPTHRWYLSDAAKDPEVALGDAGVLLEGAWGTAPSQGKGSSAAFGPFSAAFQLRFPQRGDPLRYSFTSHSYDAAWVTMLAAAWASRDDGDITGPRMESAVAALQRPEVGVPLTPNHWTELSNNLSGGFGTNIEGTSSPLEFSLDGGSPSSLYELWRVRDGGIVSETDVSP